MKRITQLILAIALLAQSVPYTFAAAPLLLFNERFSDYTEKVPYTIKTTGKDEDNTFQIQEPSPQSGDVATAKYLQVRSRNEGIPGLSMNIGKKSKRFIFNAKLRVEQNASEIMLFLRDYDMVNARLLSFTKNNVIRGANDRVQESIMSFELGQWLDISLIINSDKGEYEVYVDGHKRGDTMLLPAYNNENIKVNWSKNIRSIYIDTYNKTGKETTFSFERLIIYEASDILTDAQLIELAAPVVMDEEEVPSDIEVYSYAEFDNLETDSTNIGIGSERKRNLVYVDEFPSDEDKSIRMKGITNDNYFVLTNFDRAMNSAFVCDFKVYFHDLSSRGTFTLRDPAPLFLDVLNFSTGGQIRDIGGNNVATYKTGEWYRFKILVDMQEKKYSVYMDDTKIVNNAGLNANAKSIGLVRFHLYPPDTGESSVNVDNWKTYGGSEILPDEDIKKAASGAGSSHFTNMNKLHSVFSNKIAVIPNGNYFFANGQRLPLDSMDTHIRAYAENGAVMVPITEIAKALNIDTEFEEDSITLKYSENKIAFTQEQSVFEFNGQTHDGLGKVKNIDGRVFVPFSAIARLISATLYTQKNDLNVAEPLEQKLDPTKESRYLGEMSRYLMYDRPSPQQVMECLVERYPDNEHPRIMIEPGGFDRIKQLVETDEHMKKSYESTLSSAEAMLKQAPLTYDPAKGGGHILETSREVLRRTKALAMMFNLTGDKKYADCLWQNLEAAGNFPDWYPGHYLDVGEMAMAFAIGYDWLYNHWSKPQRKFLETAIEEKALKITLEQYESYNQSGYWIVTDNNWNVVCNGGVAVAALAVGDVMPELTGKIVHYAMWGLESMMKEFAPDGAWGEGVTYWQYTMAYFTYFASAINTALGDDFGLADSPGMSKTGYYLLHSTGPKGSFNYADAGPAFYNSPQILWLSNQLNNPELTQMLFFHRSMYGMGGGVDDLVWYEPTMNQGALAAEPHPDEIFKGAELSYLRSRYNNVNAIYAGMLGGQNDVNHGHLDTGAFILDAIGERWFLDMGGDDYSLPNYFSNLRWNYYRTRAEGHNTIILNPSAGPDQLPSSVAKIVDFVSKPRGGYSIYDMTSAYPNEGLDIKRGMMISSDRSVFTVRDELKLSMPSELYWFGHTKADINLAADGKSAILSIANKRLYVKLDSDVNAKFTVMDAKPLPTSPVYAGQNSNSGIRKLAINVKGITQGYINVTCAPLYLADEIPNPTDYPAPIALADWNESIPDGELIPFGADSISVDGVEIENFDISNRIYKFRYPFGTTAVPQVTAEVDAAYEIKIDQAATLPGKATVTVNKPQRQKPMVYLVEFVVMPGLGGTPEGAVEVKPRDVTASDVPQPENAPINTIDGDLSTRWSAFGVQWIQYDLGAEYDLANISLAWMNGATRVYPFEVYTSNDGKNFEFAAVAENSRTTNDLEIYQLPTSKARYVRIKSFGNSENEWCSLAEIKIYAKNQ